MIPPTDAEIVSSRQRQSPLSFDFANSAAENAATSALNSSLPLYVDACQLPTRHGDFVLHGFKDAAGKEHVALVYGEPGQHEVLARVHSECLTGDSLFSQRCDCGPQLESAMKRIAEHGAGVIFYLRQEGRGIGLLNKIRAYHLQDQGLDTVEANGELGFAPDSRDYSIVKFMCDTLKISSVRLLTNNPLKVQALSDLGITVSERLNHEAGLSEHNHHYLETKREKMGHLLEDS